MHVYVKHTLCLNNKHFHSFAYRIQTHSYKFRPKPEIWNKVITIICWTWLLCVRIRIFLLDCFLLEIRQSEQVKRFFGLVSEDSLLWTYTNKGILLLNINNKKKEARTILILFNASDDTPRSNTKIYREQIFSGVCMYIWEKFDWIFQSQK